MISLISLWSRGRLSLKLHIGHNRYSLSKCTLVWSTTIKFSTVLYTPYHFSPFQVSLVTVLARLLRWAWPLAPLTAPFVISLVSQLASNWRNLSLRCSWLLHLSADPRIKTALKGRKQSIPYDNFCKVSTVKLLLSILSDIFRLA